MSSERDSNRKGRLVVISGPSGTGKTSICNALLERLSDAVWSVSATTRPPRGAEAAGQAYEFIDDAEFARRNKQGDFLETAEYCGHWYGTPAEPVRRMTAAGKTVVMEIDVQGGRQIAEKMPDAVTIFVLPPDFESLKARLQGRKTESAEHMKRRLAAADGEIAIARDSGAYRYFVTNDVLETTIQEIIDIIEQDQARETNAARVEVENSGR